MQLPSPCSQGETSTLPPCQALNRKLFRSLPTNTTCAFGIADRSTMNRLVNGSCGSGSPRIRSIPNIQGWLNVVGAGTPAGCVHPATPAANSSRTISRPRISSLRIGPFVAEQLRRVEVEQYLPMCLDIAIVEFGGDPARQPGGAGADPGNVAGNLADAQRCRVIEAMDVGEPWRLAGSLFGECEIRVEIRESAQRLVGKLGRRGIAIRPGGDRIGVLRKLGPRRRLEREAGGENDEIRGECLAAAGAQHGASV